MAAKKKEKIAKWSGGRLPGGKETRSLRRYLREWHRLLNGLKELGMVPRGFDPGVAVTYKDYYMSLSVEFVNMLLALNAELKDTQEQLSEARMDIMHLKRRFDKD